MEGTDVGKSGWEDEFHHMVHLDHLGHHTGECSCLAGDHTRDGTEVQIEDEVGVRMGAQLGDQREVPSPHEV